MIEFDITEELMFIAQEDGLDTQFMIKNMVENDECHCGVDMSFIEDKETAKAVLHKILRAYFLGKDRGRLEAKEEQQKIRFTDYPFLEL